MSNLPKKKKNDKEKIPLKLDRYNGDFEGSGYQGIDE